MEDYETSLNLHSLQELPIINCKKKRENVTSDQRKVMLNFMIENPELTTHSSTRANEEYLWKELQSKLNDMKPIKTLNFWHVFWRNWKSNIKKKPEDSLKIIDLRLKKFLNHIDLVNNDLELSKSISKRKLNLEEINNELIEIQKKKTKLNLEMDELNYKIVAYRNNIKEIMKTLIDKRKLLKSLMKKKKHYNDKKLKLQVKKEADLFENSLKD